ncbi:hypothetical protein BDR04DRAFT_1118327 [Suillus decipiens]|nr:hypothetical protein BDR04DRAFT_1118327 [Suillus decipiens]
MQDGQIWKTIKGHDGKLFFNNSPDCCDKDELCIGITLGFDGFSYQHSRNVGTHSSGIIHCHWYNSWVQTNTSQKQTEKKEHELDHIHSYLETFEMPSWVGQLPGQVGYPAGGSLMSDEWKGLALIFCPIVDSDIPRTKQLLNDYLLEYLEIKISFMRAFHKDVVLQNLLSGLNTKSSDEGLSAEDQLLLDAVNLILATDGDTWGTVASLAHEMDQATEDYTYPDAGVTVEVRN